VHWFWSDQYQHSLQSAGTGGSPDRFVVRGGTDPETGFSAFCLDGDRISSVISLNRPRDVLDVRRLIPVEHAATAEQLRDATVPLKSLAVRGAARERMVSRR